MNKKVLSEIRRIETLMESQILNEQAAPIVSFIRRLIRNYGDEVTQTIIRQGDDAAETTLNAIKRGESITDDAADYLVRNLDFARLAVNLFDNAGFGKAYREKMQQAAQSIKSGAKTREQIIALFNDAIDQSAASGVLNDAPEELLVSLKKELPSILDDEIAKFEAQFFKKIGNISLKVFNKLPLVSRNFKTIVNVLAEQAKGIDNLKAEIQNLINTNITDLTDLKSVRRELENKLATIERIKDGGAERVLNEIEIAYKELLQQNKISKADFQEFESLKKSITSDQFWEKFIKPNYAQLEAEASGLGSFFKNGLKAFQPISIGRTSGKKGKAFVKLNKEAFQRMFNFLAFNSAQTGADILKRLIASAPPGQAGSNAWLRETYLRAIGPQILIPIANAILWTVLIPASEIPQWAADEMGIDVDIDAYNQSFASLMADLWVRNLINIGGEDKLGTTIQAMDLVPVLRSRLWEVMKSLYQNDDYKQPEEGDINVTDSELPPAPQTTQVPQDLKDIMGNKQNEIKVKDDGSLYWGKKEYVVEKRNGQWEVLFPNDGWYNIKTEIEL
jgi:hypothetical protein